MLTQRSRYALRALIFIARSGSIAPVPISVIAADQKLPRKFLEIILLDLKNGGLVESFRGKMGGYRLAKPASQISFGEIIRMIEGPLALVPCALLFALLAEGAQGLQALAPVELGVMVQAASVVLVLVLSRVLEPWKREAA